MCILTFGSAAEVETKKWGVREHQTSENADGENSYSFNRRISQKGAAVCLVDKDWPCVA